MMSSPALAAKKLPMCHVIVAADYKYAEGVLEHEIAHCWGWKHEVRAGTEAIAVKGGDLKPFKVPAKFKKPYPADRLVVEFMTTKDAVKACGSYGCMWFD